MYPNRNELVNVIMSFSKPKCIFFNSVWNLVLNKVKLLRFCNLKGCQCKAAKMFRQVICSKSLGWMHLGFADDKWTWEDNMWNMRRDSEAGNTLRFTWYAAQWLRALFWFLKFTIKSIWQRQVSPFINKSQLSHHKKRRSKSQNTTDCKSNN